ncbi:MAG: hypothetical protein AB1757_19400 [Acidobacteriota bacterium]
MAEKIHRYPCPSCSADLLYDARDACLTCPFCGRKEPIPQSADEVNERAFEQYLQISDKHLAVLYTNALEVKCNSCSATVTFAPPQVAGECPFCGSQIVAQPKAADPLVAPEGILPFSLNQQNADEALKKWLSTRWFAPNALKHLAYREGASGIYLPYWTFDAHATTFYEGERGEHYYVTEEFTQTDAQGNSVRRTRQVQKTRWYAAGGQVENWFDDLLVAATKSIATERLRTLEPWDLHSLKAYEPAFIAGFKAQRYEIELQAGFEIAKQQMVPSIENAIRQDIGGDEQRIHHYRSHYSGITFKHILLPVFLGAYRFRQKPYQVMINARTGLVQGERPYSFWKIFFFVLTLIIIIGLLIFLFSGKN